MVNRGVHLVFGYLRNIDYPDRDAQSLGLPCRFAVVMRAYPRQQIEFFFDTELILKILAGVFAVVDHDQLSIQLDRNVENTLGNLEELAQYYTALPASVREPFTSAKLLRQNQPVALCRMRSDCHGRLPDPYKSSYVTEFFLKESAEQKLTQACQQACQSVGASLERQMQGLPHARISFWQKVQDFITYDVQYDTA